MWVEKLSVGILKAKRKKKYAALKNVISLDVTEKKYK